MIEVEEMIIKEIIIGCKKSKNYQTYECTEVITIIEGEDVDAIKDEAFERCRKSTDEQIAIDDLINVANVYAKKTDKEKGDSDKVTKILTKIKSID
jgi:hypothetical protein